MKEKNRQKIKTINQSVESKKESKEIASNTFQNKIKFQAQIKCILMTSLAGSHTLHKRIAMLCLNEHCYYFMYCVGSTKRWCQNALLSIFTKGQLVSKANCQVVNSSKKRTNEFVFTSIRHVFVRFLEEIEDSKNAFRNYLTFTEANDST